MEMLEYVDIFCMNIFVLAIYCLFLPEGTEESDESSDPCASHCDFPATCPHSWITIHHPTLTSARPLDDHHYLDPFSMNFS